MRILESFLSITDNNFHFAHGYATLLLYEYVVLLGTTSQETEKSLEETDQGFNISVGPRRLLWTLFFFNCYCI